MLDYCGLCGVSYDEDKHIKKLVEDAGRRLLFARDSIAEAGKTKQP